MVPKAKKILFLAAAAILLPCLFGCPMYTAVAFKYAEAGDDPGKGQSLGDDPTEVQSASSQVTLGWDPPPSAVEAYKLFFRIHNTTDWYTLADDLPAVPAPEYTVLHADIGSGMFDFGVIARDAEAHESSMHMSLETSAQPDSGWFLIWEP
jgi:hypothetical protein